MRRDAGAAKRGGDAGGVVGKGAVHGAELRLQRLRRAGHLGVEVERQVGRRDWRRARARPPEPGAARGGAGAGAPPCHAHAGEAKLLAVAVIASAATLGWLEQVIRVARAVAARFHFTSPGPGPGPYDVYRAGATTSSCRPPYWPIRIGPVLITFFF